MTHPQRRPRLLAALAVAVLAVVTGGCRDGSLPSTLAESGSAATDDSSSANARVADLAVIGGVQDVWSLPFSMNADRNAVVEALGTPEFQTARSLDERDGGPEAVSLGYEGLVIEFLTETSDGNDYLISARVTADSGPLRGGLRVGMETPEALELLGEPQLRSGASLVYFYRSTTIELVESNGRVAEVVLSRALP